MSASPMRGSDVPADQAEERRVAGQPTGHRGTGVPDEGGRPRTSRRWLWRVRRPVGAAPPGVRILMGCSVWRTARRRAAASAMVPGRSPGPVAPSIMDRVPAGCVEAASTFGCGGVAGRDPGGSVERAAPAGSARDRRRERARGSVTAARRRILAWWRPITYTPPAMTRRRKGKGWSRPQARTIAVSAARIEPSDTMRMVATTSPKTARAPSAINQDIASTTPRPVATDLPPEKLSQIERPCPRTAASPAKLVAHEADAAGSKDNHGGSTGSMAA